MFDGWKMASVFLMVGLILLLIQDEIKLCRLNKSFKRALICFYVLTIMASGFIGYYFNYVFTPLFLITIIIFDMFWGVYVFKTYKSAYFEVNEKAL